MAKWSSSETGILRKKRQKDNYEDLLVFGYACKLFRDDEKALFIDQGKHLIPWMGDEKLRIDRYDGRGTLSELSLLEAGKEGYDTIRWLGLSESERKLELLCDEERYYALHTNEDEENMYKEEELKRNQQKSNEIQYSYDVAPDPAASQNVLMEVTVEEEDKPFIPPQELDVPADIQIPKTIKENARIEKTAVFVSQQGPQMEILIKAKQSDNAQFNFMNQSDPLFKYYRHVLSAIKSGRYRIPKSEAEELKDDGDLESSDEHYLHPSLLAPSVPLARPVAPLPQIPYKPSADCAYSQLVNRIQGNQADQGAKQPSTQMTYEQQQYYQYYYTMQYYEYYKQMAQYQNFGTEENGENATQAIPQHLQEQYSAQAASLAQSAYAQFVQQQNSNNNPYAQIVTNLSQGTENEVAPEEALQTSKIEKAPVLYSQTEIADPVVFIGPQQPEKINTEADTATPLVVTTNTNTKPLASLVHYGSDSEDYSSEEEPEVEQPVLQPPAEAKVVIDKMASYVSKNGSDFEAIVKSKGDTRFEFLSVDHEYHRYYKSKIQEFSQEASKEEDAKEKKETPTKSKEKKVITPVSFSIKKPKEHEAPKEIKSALPVEESDDESADQTEALLTPADSNSPAQIPITTIIAPRTPPESVADPIQLIVVVPPPSIENKETNGIIDVDDPILEMIDLTDDSEERRDARRAEDRIKDKLAAAAREKLASVSRDRALQMERKKKAAAFLKLKSAESDGPKDEIEIRSIVKVDDKVHTISDSDNSKDESDRKKSRNDDSGTEEGEIKRHKKSSKKRKSHKRRSKSKHDSRHKKSKKRRRRSDSNSSYTG